MPYTLADPMTNRSAKVIDLVCIILVTKNDTSITEPYG